MTVSRTKRRRFLYLAGGGLVAGLGLYSYRRGVRYPPLHWIGAPPATGGQHAGVEVGARGALLQAAGDHGFRFRAFVPEPEFTVRGAAATRITVQNLHPGATLEVSDAAAARRDPVEDRAGLTRSLVLGAAPVTRFAWRFPKREQYRFAAIGDSGGGTELEWVLARASALGADFLIHLGDFYYEAGDFERAERHLNGARIPTYAAIGNHDFSTGWQWLFPTFHRLVGPGNARFTLGGIEFLNFDTAADFLPAARGQRARVLAGMTDLATSTAIRDRVAFTHTPLHDPDAERGHGVGRRGEADWLRERLLAAGTRTLLAGHIHIRAEFDNQGLHTLLSGQGLGHADLVGPEPYRRFADILLGEVTPGTPVRYRWQPLNMPFEAHCSARNLGVLDAMARPRVKQDLRRACGRA